MPSALRSRLTYANIVATLALVFAMSGGALAATHYLITSTKQISPRVLKELKGKEGTAGAAGREGSPGKEGVAGKAGANGARGSNGESVLVSELAVGGECKEGGSKFEVGGKAAHVCNGAKGKEGKSVVVAEEAAGANSHCEEGGSNFEAAGSGTKQGYACNGKEGKEGSPWTDKGVLPAGATETGNWSFFYTRIDEEGEEGEFRHVPISFPIPLAGPLSVTDCPTGSECHVHIVPANTTGTGACQGGNANVPKADPGNLCIYVGQLAKAEDAELYLDPKGGQEVGVTGLLWTVVLTGKKGSEGEGYGSWAVTG